MKRNRTGNLSRHWHLLVGVNNFIILFDKEFPQRSKMSKKVMTLPDILSDTAKKVFQPVSFATSKH